MPSWKKLIISGSDAALSSLVLTTGSLALNVTGGRTRLSSSVDITGSVNIRNGNLVVSGSLNTSTQALIYNGQTVVNWGGSQLVTSTGQQTVDWESRVLTITSAANPTLNWGSSTLVIGATTQSLDWGQRKLLADAASTVSEWSNTLITNAGSPSTYQWRRNSTYPFSVGYDLQTWNTESLDEDNFITTAGKININLEPSNPTPVINALSNYGNNVNLIEKSFIKIDYVITDVDPISSAPSWLRVGYLEIYSDRINTPTLAYSSSIKTDFGTVPDISYSNSDTQENWTTRTEIYFINNGEESQNIYLKYNIWAM
jgi:hypothetical protein